MKETILLYHMDNDIETIIRKIAEQLDVEVKNIKDEDICQKMGYLLNIDEYKREEDIEVNDDLLQAFMFFAGMVEKQLDLLLDVFKMAKIPFIPYKAMLTEHNIEYPFYQLYKNVAHEYEQMKM